MKAERIPKCAQPTVVLAAAPPGDWAGSFLVLPSRPWMWSASTICMPPLAPSTCFSRKDSSTVSTRSTSGEPTPMSSGCSTGAATGAAASAETTGWTGAVSVVMQAARQADRGEKPKTASGRGSWSADGAPASSRPGAKPALQLLALLVHHPRHLHQDALRGTLQVAVAGGQGVGVEGEAGRRLGGDLHQGVDAGGAAHHRVDRGALDHVHRGGLGAVAQLQAAALAGDLEELQQLHHAALGHHAGEGGALLLEVLERIARAHGLEVGDLRRLLAEGRGIAARRQDLQAEPLAADLQLVAVAHALRRADALAVDHHAVAAAQVRPQPVALVVPAHLGVAAGGEGVLQQDVDPLLATEDVALAGAQTMRATGGGDEIEVDVHGACSGAD